MVSISFCSVMRNPLGATLWRWQDTWYAFDRLRPRHSALIKAGNRWLANSSRRPRRAGGPRRRGANRRRGQCRADQAAGQAIWSSENCGRDHQRRGQPSQARHIADYRSGASRQVPIVKGRPKPDRPSGSLLSPCPGAGEARGRDLALRELEAAASLGPAVLLALYDARIAGQEALALDRGAQRR